MSSTQQSSVIARVIGAIVGLVIVGFAVYAWLFALGGGSWKSALRVLLIIGGVLFVAGSNNRKLSKAVKGTVLGGAVLVAVSWFLPIETPVGWLVSLLFAGIAGAIGYIILFEDFFH